jgi:methionine--tRNA ligase beta chain
METRPIVDNTITFDDFESITSKLDIRYGNVIASVRVPKSKKLLQLTVVFNESGDEKRTILTNIGNQFDPENLEGKTLPFILNFPPATIMGIVSEGMIILPNLDGYVYLENPTVGSKLF